MIDIVFPPPYLAPMRLLISLMEAILVLTGAGSLEELDESELERFEAGTTVDVAALVEAGVVKNPRDGVKILGNGELSKKLDVKANAFSASAKEKIEAAGGSAEVI